VPVTRTAPPNWADGSEGPERETTTVAGSRRPRSKIVAIARRHARLSTRFVTAQPLVDERVLRASLKSVEFVTGAVLDEKRSERLDLGSRRDLGGLVDDLGDPLCGDLRKALLKSLLNELEGGSELIFGASVGHRSTSCGRRGNGSDPRSSTSFGRVN
jgi:hypothetical protein